MANHRAKRDTEWRFEVMMADAVVRTLDGNDEAVYNYLSGKIPSLLSLGKSREIVLAALEHFNAPKEILLDFKPKDDYEFKFLALINYFCMVKRRRRGE